MEKLKLILIIPLFLIACSNPTELQNDDSSNGNVQITFQNISSSNLQNVIVADRKIGTLNAQSSSRPIGFESFGFDTGMVDENVSVIVNFEEFNNHDRGFWCGTEKVRIDSGSYTIKIDLNNSQLSLFCENPPLITFGN